MTRTNINTNTRARIRSVPAQTVADLQASPATAQGTSVPHQDTPAPRHPRGAKQRLVLDLLQRDGGATLPELAAATGWLPHTTRAVLTRLRQGGHALTKTQREDKMTAYALVGSILPSPAISAKVPDEAMAAALASTLVS